MKRCVFTLGVFFFLAFWSVSEAAQEVKQEIVEFLKPKLNSDRIEYFFGSYGVDKLDIDSPLFPESRIANLHSVHQGQKIMRTLAIVDYFLPTHNELQGVHSEIREGKSIGIALRDAGWTVNKKPVYFGSIPISTGLKSWMGENSDNTAAVHVYRLEVSKCGSPASIPYCTIIEVHNPEYLSDEWLKALYDDQYKAYSCATEESNALLSKLSDLIQTFPKN